MEPFLLLHKFGNMYEKPCFEPGVKALFVFFDDLGGRITCDQAVDASIIVSAKEESVWRD